MLDTKFTKSTTFHPQIDGQTNVINKKVIHIMCMYNSEHANTWGESLPYVQQKYNRTLHNSMGPNPFHIVLGFQPLCSINVAIPFAATHADLTHVQSEADMTNRFIEHIQHIH